MNTETTYDFEAGTKPVVAEERQLPRIGIYAGGFDPVHAGHIRFALKAQKVAGLNEVYFVPERKPLDNHEPEHHVHRSIMLGHALRPYDDFHIFDLPDARLNARSFTRVADGLPEAEYCLLTAASDLLWGDGDLLGLYQKMHLVVAVVSHAQMAEVLERLTNTDTPLGNLTFVDIGTDHISSADVRKGIREGKRVYGVLPSVLRYARSHWLYLPPIRLPR